MLKLENDTLESLRRLKREMKTKKQLKADMWCHFGMFIIRRPIEGIVWNRLNKQDRLLGLSAYIFKTNQFCKETLPIASVADFNVDPALYLLA